MSFSLYQAVVPLYRQLLGGLDAVLAKAEAWCEETTTPPSELIEARLAPDMWDLARQVHAACLHASGGLAALASGEFSPPRGEVPGDLAGLRAEVAAAIAAVAAATPEALDGAVGRDVIFALGDLRIPFTAENFLIGFSIPNFTFHVTTAYDILRLKGVPVGKRDYLGRLPVKRD